MSMTPDRFEHLAATLGSDINRWPEAERQAARMLAAEPQARAALTEAMTLDALLDEWRVKHPSAALRDRVMAKAPFQRERTRAPLRLGGLQTAGGLRLWLAGAGVAAGLAGVSCGAVLSSVAIREAQDEALVAAAVSESSPAVSVSEPVRTP